MSALAWPEGGGFHIADGLFVTRLPDGSVRIRKFPPGRRGYAAAEATLDVTETPEEWASVVASMSAAGETPESYEAALARQRPPTS